MSAAPIWSPTPERIDASNIRRFALGHADGIGPERYAALHRWSVEQPRQFWRAAADFCAVRFSREPDSILEDEQRMPGARWFPGATLNYAENLIEAEPDGTALIFVNERGDRESMTRDELRRQVAAVASALSAAGVTAGDRVAGILPNRPETIVAALAAASIGAIWSSCSPDFGVEALLDRLGQIEPKVIFGTIGYYYNGKTIDCLKSLRAVTDRLPGKSRIVVIDYGGTAGDTGLIPGAVSYAEFASAPATPDYLQLPFDHPLFILYSSGTTGAPKCIVHGAGGTLLQHRKEHVLHTDIKPGDVVFYFTTCGWMMWNWLLSTLASGATVLLYDGSPFYPDPNVLWRIAEREGIDIFGTSARYLGALEASGARPVDQCELPALRTILSTGSPLPPSSFDFVADAVGGDIQTSSIAGGTDIISCFMLGNPTLPVYRGEIQCRGLGMDVRIYDDNGTELRGEKGELVCVRPFPSMPVGFWNDPDQSRYRHSYFKRYPGVWCHGDYAELTDHGGIIIHGRSDAVLNPGGVRIGTAEIYRVVEQLAEVEESLAVGQEWDGDTRIVLFVRLTADARLDEELIGTIKNALRERCSPRHVPAKIIAVTEIPRTINGKISELAVREVIHGRAATNLGALANPGCLDQFRDLEELRR